MEALRQRRHRRTSVHSRWHLGGLTPGCRGAPVPAASTRPPPPALEAQLLAPPFCCPTSETLCRQPTAIGLTPHHMPVHLHLPLLCRTPGLRPSPRGSGPHLLLLRLLGQGGHYIPTCGPVPFRIKIKVGLVRIQQEPGLEVGLKLGSWLELNL